MSESDQTSLRPADSVSRGIGIGCALHFSQILILPAIAYGVPLVNEKLSFSPLLFAIAGWSVTQFLYLGPAAWWAFHKGEKETGKGILMLAALGVLLNSACDAMLFLNR